MELTTKGWYAVMALADLAEHAGDGVTCLLSVVAERQGLSLVYLEQLFVPLCRAGLVESTRGCSGGYRLTKLAKEISVAAIMVAVEGDAGFTCCSHSSNPCCSAASPCVVLHGLWNAISEKTWQFLSSVSLVDVVAGGRYSAHPGMTARRTYLDYNATAPLRPEVKAAMVDAFDVDGSPSSVHAEGRHARSIVEAARESIARLVGAKPSEIVFTSGASEANTWVLSQPWATILTSGIEHDSVLAPARASSGELVMLPVCSDGMVTIKDVAERLASRSFAHPSVIAVQLANNETGVIQPVREIAELARVYTVKMHIDAVQAAGRVPIDFASLDIDTLAISAHKFGGPKGVGALAIREHVDFVPLIRGGGQERCRRAGTENIAAIAGFGVAAEAALRDLAAVATIGAMRNKLEVELKRVSPNAVIIGEGVPRLANTIALALPGKLAETLVIRLDLAGIAVSAGSACSSGKVGASHVLEAMGLGQDIASGTIRVSFGSSTEDDITAFLAAWKTIVGTSALAA